MEILYCLELYTYTILLQLVEQMYLINDQM